MGNFDVLSRDSLIDVSLHDSAAKVNEKVLNVFPDEKIDALFAEVDKQGKVTKENFLPVFSVLFDKDFEQSQFLLDNAYFVDRCFAFLDQEKKGELTVKDFERVGEIFSPDDEEMTNFRFFVYDKEGKGYITREDLTRMFRSCFETNLKIRLQDLEKDVKDGNA